MNAAALPDKIVVLPERSSKRNGQPISSAELDLALLKIRHYCEAAGQRLARGVAVMYLQSVTSKPQMSVPALAHGMEIPLERAREIAIRLEAAGLVKAEWQTIPTAQMPLRKLFLAPRADGKS